jgi:hypothetical protein
MVTLEPDAEFTNAISNGAIIKSWREKGGSEDAFAREQRAIPSAPRKNSTTCRPIRGN